MIETPQEKFQQDSFQEVMVEEVSDDKLEERAARARKGKFLIEEDIASVHEPRVPHEKERKKELFHDACMDNKFVITEVSESSDLKNAEVDLDPRLPELEKKMGLVEDTTPILVDENDHSKILQVGSRLEVDLRATPLFQSTFPFLKGHLCYRPE